MAQAKTKTQATDVAVEAFLESLPDPRRREDGRVLDAIHRKVTGCEPRMWGPSIVGYGSYTYRYDSGREGTSARAAFSPRKPAAVVYLNGTYDVPDRARADALLARLGPHTIGKSCLYLKRLERIDMGVLEALIGMSWEAMNARWPD